MHLFKVEKEWSYTSRESDIIFLGDFHVGATNCDYKLLQQHVADIEEMENPIVILMGDNAEWIIPSDKRWRSSQIDRQFWDSMESLPMAYLDYLEELLIPIADKIEVIHDGNHERSIASVMYPTAELCSRLRKHVEKKHGKDFAMNKLRYAPGMAFTRVQWKKKSNSDYRSIMINTQHGHQSGRKDGAKHNSLGDMFRWVDADIIMRGHSHSLFVTPGPVRIAPNPSMTKIVETQTYYGNTGSYLKTLNMSEQPSYAEQAEYPPLPRGNVQIHVKIQDSGLTMSPHIHM